MNSEALLMNTSARQGLQRGGAAQAAPKDSSSRANANFTTTEALTCDTSQSVRKIRVRVDS